MEKKELAMKEIRISELRALDISDNDDNNEMIIEGYAAVFETETDLGWCKEIISRDAFNNCNMSDCVMKYNHNDNILILARTRNKSLELTVDNKGLKIRAKLIDTTQNKDIYKMVKAGLLDKMSFAFSVRKQEWDYERNQNLTPNQISPNSHKKVWWICKNGHEWEAQVKSRNYGCGCPMCAKGRKKQE